MCWFWYVAAARSRERARSTAEWLFHESVENWVCVTPVSISLTPSGCDRSTLTVTSVVTPGVDGGTITGCPGPGDENRGSGRWNACTTLIVTGGAARTRRVAMISVDRFESMALTYPRAGVPGTSTELVGVTYTTRTS